MKGGRFTLMEPENKKLGSYRAPRPLLELQKSAKHFLSARLAAVFEHVDDTFFDLADRAEDSYQQTTYFDAMRLIRVERKGIELEFSSHLEFVFGQLGDGNWQGEMNGHTHRQSRGLELIENEDLEEIIALDTMVSSASERCKAEIELLSTRINELVPAVVTQKNNPLGPDTICDAFGRAVEALDIGIRSKLVFFKLFDRHVLNPLKELLVKCNQTLKDMGVLPDLELKLKAKRNSSAASKPPASKGRRANSKEPEQNRSSGNERYGQLLSQLQHWFEQEAGDGHSGSAGQADAGSELGLNELMDAITSMQSEWRQGGSESAEEADLLSSLKRCIAQQTDDNSQMSVADQGVVNLVGRLFGRIAEQAYISPGITEELKKLELPVLKMALQDPTFFDRDKHPGRRLLNEIAQASIGFSGEANIGRDPITKSIAEVIATLIQSRELTNALLTELLGEFIALVEKDRRRVAVLEQRIIDEVTASERVNRAHSAVNEVLAEHLLDKKLPRIIVEFAQNAWCKVLFLAFVKSGAESDAWQDNIRLLAKLLSLATASKAELSADEVNTTLAAIREQLQHISYDSYEAGSLIGAMEQYFSAKYDDVFEGGSDLDPQASPFMEEVTVDHVESDLPGEPVEEDSEVPDNLEEDYLHQADCLMKGSWVEVTGDESDKKRCKVAGIVSPPGKFIFVNRKGAKVAEKNRKRVALEIKDQKLILLDNSHLFEDALEQVIEEIRETQLKH